MDGLVDRAWRKVKKERVAIVKSSMNKRGNDNNSSVVIETTPKPLKIKNMRNRRFTENKNMIRHTYNQR
jgi:hypothetical protein